MKRNSWILIFFVVIVILLICLFFRLCAPRAEANYDLLKQPQEVILGDSIPKQLFFTIQDKSKIPQKVFVNWRQFCQGLKIEIFDDQECEEFVKRYFAKHVIQKFLTLNGPHRADLFRYCILFIRGGIYLDIKSKLIEPIEHLFKEPRTLYTVLSSRRKSIYQGLLASPPGNPIFLKAIDAIVKTPRYANKIFYHVFTTQFYRILNESTINRQLLPGINILQDESQLILFEEVCTKKCETRDRYGKCCSINSSNRSIMDVRWPDYPWK